MRCPECGTVRTLSLEHALRIERGQHPATCGECRRPPRVVVTEALRLYWLVEAGVPSSQLTGGAASYVARHGIPEKLAPLVASASLLPPYK